jgi:hypothetical protein
MIPRPIIDGKQQQPSVTKDASQIRSDLKPNDRSDGRHGYPFEEQDRNCHTSSQKIQTDSQKIQTDSQKIQTDSQKIQTDEGKHPQSLPKTKHNVSDASSQDFHSNISTLTLSRANAVSKSSVIASHHDDDSSNGTLAGIA